MTDNFKENICKVCKDCIKINKHMYGCFCEPYKGKWIAEIEECPKMEKREEITDMRMVDLKEIKINKPKSKYEDICQDCVRDGRCTIQIMGGSANNAACLMLRKVKSRVYVVMKGIYDELGMEIKAVGVFSTEEKANNWIELNQGRLEEYWVEEFVVDEE